MRAWDNGHCTTGNEQSTARFVYRYENVLRFYLILPSTVHGNGTPYSACEVFWFLARATNESIFCLTTSTVFIFLTTPCADENHDLEIAPVPVPVLVSTSISVDWDWDWSQEKNTGTGTGIF